MKEKSAWGAIQSYRLVQPYFKEKRLAIFLGLFSLFVVDMLQLFVPRVVKWVVDDLTTGNMTEALLFRYAVYIVCIALLIGGFRFIWRRCLIGTSRRVEEGLRNRFLRHIQKLSAPFFDEKKTGDLMALSTNDVQNVRMAVGMGMVALTDAIVLGSAAIGFMAYIDVKLTVLAFLPMPVIAILARFLTRKMHRQYKEVQASFGELTESIRERVSGIRVVKAFNLERNEVLRVRRMSKDYVVKNIQLVRLTGSFFPGMMFFANVSLAIILFVGGRQAIDLVITPGDFVAFISYLGLLTWPMMAMGWVINLIQRGAASLDRINAVLETQPHIVSALQPQTLRQVLGHIAFQQVGFRYAAHSPPALENISLEVKPGQMLGIIGPTGSGKSTLCQLIPRIHDVTNGCLLLDGVDIRRLPLEVLRSHVAVAPQDAFLFSGSMKDNLCFGNTDVSEEDMVTACRAAQFYTTLMELPDRFDTVIGEKGVTLSGGQRQRLALARALLVKTPILVLDDPLSQVDTETAAAILAHISGLFSHRTTIMVSHRINHVRNADLIVVLEQGRVSAVGKHEALMAVPGYYSRMYRLQEIEAELGIANNLS